MHSTRVLMTFAAVILTGAAMAHPGVPGHVHPQMPLGLQVLHAAMNWAPVAGLGLIAVWGAFRAKATKPGA